MGISLGDALIHLGVDSSELDRDMKTAVDNVKNQMRMVGAAFTAAGVAGLKMVADSRQLNAQLGQTAITLGVTAKEMRDLTLATTDVSFPVKSVAETFDLLSRAGVKNIGTMQANAKAFDALAGATGSSAEVVADLLIPAFKALGVELPKNSRDLDKFTWLTKNTTVDLAEFGSVMQYVAMYGADLNITIDDMIGIMAALEARGITGSAATRLFRTAVEQAKDGTVTFNEALGVSQEQIDGYTSKTKDATGLTDKYTDVANTQYTIMDRLGQLWSEMTLKVSGFLEPLEPILAAMTALGPAMIFLSTSVGIATVKWIAHTAALVAHRIAALASAAANAVLNASLGIVGWALIALGAALAIGIPLLLKLTGATKEASKEMDAYSRSLFENKLMSQLTTDEWVQAYERGYLLEDQIKKIARGLGISTEELLKNMQAAGLLEAVITSGTDTGKIYIRQLDDQTKGLAAVQQKTRELTQAQQALNDNWDRFLADISPGVKAFQEYSLTTEDVISYMARAGGSIDSVVLSLKEQGIEANNVKYHLEELGIAAQDVADYVGKKRVAIEREKTADEKAAEAVAKLRKEFEYESSEAGRLRLSINDVIYTMFALGETDTEVTATLAALGDESDNVNALLRLTGITVAQVSEVMKAQKDDADALADSYGKLGEAAKQIITPAQAAAGAYMKTFTSKELEAVAASMAREGYNPTQIASATAWMSKGYPTYQHGGLIPEPTLLTSLRTLKPYAIAGEKGKEWVTPEPPNVLGRIAGKLNSALSPRAPVPAGAGAVSSGNITINVAELHVREEADVNRVAEKMVALIRLRTGSIA